MIQKPTSTPSACWKRDHASRGPDPAATPAGGADGSGAPLTLVSRPARSADEVFACWAVGTSNGGPLCHLIGTHLFEGSDKSLRTCAPTEAHPPAVRLAWDRLERTGLLALIDEWRDAARRTPSLRDAHWATRVCRLVDQTTQNDPTAALVKVHGTAPPEASLTERFEQREQVLNFATKVPEPQMPQSSKSGRAPVAATSAGSRVVRSVSARSEGESAAGSLAQASASLTLRQAIGPRALMPQHSIRSQISVESSGLPSLDLLSFHAADPGEAAEAASGPPSPVPVARGEAAQEPLDLRHPADQLHPPAPASPSASDHSDTWSWSSWGQSQPGSTGRAAPYAESLHSLRWLPSMRTSSDPSAWSLASDLGAEAPGMADLTACRQILATPDCPGLSATETLLRDWAQELLSSYLDESRPLLLMSPEEAALLARTSATAARKWMAIPRDPAASGDNMERSTESRQALTAIARWVDAASGTEGVRRERWLQYLTHRSFDAMQVLQLPAVLVEQGKELPPEEALDALLPPDSLAEHGTLVWRNQLLSASPGLGALLDRLGVRHLDLNATPTPPRDQLQRLRNVDITAATLGHTRKLSSASVMQQIRMLELELPALYIVRLSDQHNAVERGAAPAGWVWDPQVPGQLRHVRRDANRKRMTALRDLWPDGRMPPALRARAVNALPEGESVLDYLGRVHQQRSATAQFGRGDVELCAHLITIIDGLSKDAEFARRCRDMAARPAGPCADGGTLTLSAMSALRDASEATSIEQVAQNAFVQACLARASADRAHRRPRFKETVEDAMILRWHVSQVLAELLGDDRVRAGDKPVFGAYVEGTDWNSPVRRAAFRKEAKTLVAQEVADGFPGVVMLLSATEDPLGSVFQTRLDREPACAAFLERREAAQRQYAEAVDNGEDEQEVAARTAADLASIDEAHGAQRLALLQPGLDDIRARVEAQPEPSAPGLGPALSPRS